MRREAGLALLLLLAGCAGGLPRLVEPEPARIANDVAGAADAPARAAELRRLQAGPLASRDRLELAWLLARKGARTEDLQRAQDLLAGQESAYAEGGSRQLFLLVQRAVQLELDLRAERRHAAALQEKIDRLVDLERRLHERATTQEVK